MREVDTVGGKEQHEANLLAQSIRRDLRAHQVRWIIFCILVVVLVIGAVEYIPDIRGFHRRSDWLQAVWDDPEFPFLFIIFGAAALLYVYHLQRTPDFECTHCKISNSLLKAWVCGYCGRSHNTFFGQVVTLFFLPLTPCVDPCEGCGKRPPAIACYHCGEHLALDFFTYDENLDHVAKFKSGSDPVLKDIKDIETPP